jgi:hypothetical protein
MLGTSSRDLADPISCDAAPAVERGQPHDRADPRRPFLDRKSNSEGHSGSLTGVNLSEQKARF